MCDCKNIKEEYQTFKNGTRHLRQTCRDCGKFLGFKQQDLPANFIMPFGKHKGENIDDLKHDYLKWLHDQEWVKDNMKSRIDQILSPSNI
jgi:uncharacterized protein (DUF3820 family)